MTRLIVSTDLDLGLTAQLVRPSGVPVQGSDPDVELTLLPPVAIAGIDVAEGPIYSVTAPQAGLWRVQVAGGGQTGTAYFSVVASAEITPNGAAVQFSNFEFVTRQDGPFGGYIPIQGLPVAGTPVTVRARLINAPSNPVFRLIDESGATLQTLSLSNDSPDAKPDYFLGTATPPAVPFTVVMDGTDASGVLVRRQFPANFLAQTVTVSIADVGTPLVAGSSRQVAFSLNNLGTVGATFELDVVTTPGSVHDLSPGTLSVGPGSAATATFSLDTPVDALEGSALDLRITATNTANPALYNSREF
jgi:hypothetical protein